MSGNVLFQKLWEWRLRQLSYGLRRAQSNSDYETIKRIADNIYHERLHQLKLHLLGLPSRFDADQYAL